MATLPIIARSEKEKRYALVSSSAVRIGLRRNRDRRKYPGGNIVVDSIDKEVVRLQTDLRDTAGWWFYWNFRIRGAQEAAALEFDRQPIGLLDRP